MLLRNRSEFAYHGHGDGREVGCAPGRQIEVSEALGARLLKDFPQTFERVEESGRHGEERGSASPREAVHGAPGSEASTASPVETKSPPPASPMGHEQAPAPADPPRYRRKRGRS